MHCILRYNPRMAKRSTSFRLSDDALALLAALAKSLGISQTAAIEIALRDTATARGVKVESGNTKGGKLGKGKPTK